MGRQVKGISRFNGTDEEAQLARLRADSNTIAPPRAGPPPPRHPSGNWVPIRRAVAPHFAEGVAAKYARHRVLS